MECSLLLLHFTIVAVCVLFELHRRGMWSSATLFVAGYASSSSCNALLCQAELNLPNRTFKLSILVHSTNLNEVKPGMMHDQRPYVAITFGGRTKETELADWSEEKGQWCFHEIVTVETSLEEELSISVSSLTSYKLHEPQWGLVRALSVRCVSQSQTYHSACE